MTGRKRSTRASDGAKALGLRLLLPLPIGMPITRGGYTAIRQQRQEHVTKSAVFCGYGARRGRKSLKGVPTGSARSVAVGQNGHRRGTGAGAVTTAGGGRGRGTRGGVLARRMDGRQAPPGPKPSHLAAVGAVPVAGAVRHVQIILYVCPAWQIYIMNCTGNR